jgi:hypothetical protein
VRPPPTREEFFHQFVLSHGVQPALLRARDAKDTAVAAISNASFDMDPETFRAWCSWLAFQTPDRDVQVLLKLATPKMEPSELWAAYEDHARTHIDRVRAYADAFRRFESEPTPENERRARELSEGPGGLTSLQLKMARQMLAEMARGGSGEPEPKNPAVNAVLTGGWLKQGDTFTVLMHSDFGSPTMRTLILQKQPELRGEDVYLTVKEPRGRKTYLFTLRRAYSSDRRRYYFWKGAVTAPEPRMFTSFDNADLDRRASQASRAPDLVGTLTGPAEKVPGGVATKANARYHLAPRGWRR